ncbi:hypothetical protein DP939_33935 [Spongiactinospora rosea]|uniref:Peptidase M15A C-terminal domain-containing protein n=1 Tax=Spongiactinospora rosea TaxID=2248750 RepID=A0A366LP49_9ACTN|nr:hypothetical protein [Spongiactinospora rosea]RBQ15691.1 hypothetical protein DP939_33935 [Spongiactinospora rosea]
MRFAACVLLAVQTSIIALNAAEADAAHARVALGTGSPVDDTGTGGTGGSEALPDVHGQTREIAFYLARVLPTDVAYRSAPQTVQQAMTFQDRGEAAAERKRARSAVRLGHHKAMRRVKRAGVRWHSSGGCTDRGVRTCTSLASVRAGTISAVIALKRESRCPIKITGGTEAGHAPGAYSHGNGYKLDITLNACVDHFITHNYPLYSVRGDGARLYRGPGGDVYARESDHWDILFR